MSKCKPSVVWSSPEKLGFLATSAGTVGWEPRQGEVSEGLGLESTPWELLGTSLVPHWATGSLKMPLVGSGRFCLRISFLKL